VIRIQICAISARGTIVEELYGARAVLNEKRKSDTV
jgi:hypothetical protein